MPFFHMKLWLRLVLSMYIRNVIHCHIIFEASAYSFWLFRLSDNVTETGKRTLLKSNKGWTINVDPCSSSKQLHYRRLHILVFISLIDPLSIQKKYVYYNGNSFWRMSRFRESQASNKSFLEAQLQQRQITCKMHISNFQGITKRFSFSFNIIP